MPPVPTFDPDGPKETRFLSLGRKMLSILESSLDGGAV